MPNTLRTVIILIVAVVWAVNFSAPIFVNDYKPTPELNVAFMAILGVLTASYNRDEKKRDEKQDEKKKKEEKGDDADEEV